MIDAGSIKAILDVYSKHGWTLRRVLLSDALRKSLSPDAGVLFGDLPAKTSSLDALWFSRASKGTMVAWELRHLSNVPYALLEGVDSQDDDDVLEEALAETETRMQNALHQRI